MISDSFKIALAIDILCFCPPESRTPFSPFIVSYLKGNFFMNSSEAANLQAFIISSSDAFGLAYEILFLTVSSKRMTSWLTKDKFCLS